LRPGEYATGSRKTQPLWKNLTFLRGTPRSIIRSCRLCYFVASRRAISARVFVATQARPRHPFCRGVHNPLGHTSKAGPRPPPDVPFFSPVHPTPQAGRLMGARPPSLALRRQHSGDRRCACARWRPAAPYGHRPRPYGVNYDPAWRNQARPIDQWDDPADCDRHGRQADRGEGGRQK